MKTVNRFIVATVFALTLSAQAFASYFDAVMSDRPEAYWRMGELTGNLAFDISGNGHNAVFSGVTLGIPGAIEGDTDTAVLFDNSDLIQAGSTTLMPNLDSWSVEAWVKTQATGRFMAIISWYPGGYLWGHNSNYILAVTEQGLPCYDIRDVNANAINITGGAPITDSAWHHLVGVLDRQGGNIRLYVDGNEVASAPVSGMGIITDASGIPVNVGGQDRYWSNPWPFMGTMDEVAIYRGALSAERVRLHNEVGRGLASDVDGDGVPDGLDKCSATPPGSFVDASGCISYCPSRPSQADIDAEVQKGLAAQNASLAEKEAVIASLRTDVEILTATVSSKEQTIVALESRITALDAAILSLQQQVAALPASLSTIFGDPGFVLPGGTFAEQIDSLTGAIGKMPQGQIKKLQELLVP